MRIVIDLQAAQSTGSRNRGIGRYSLSLAQAMVRNCGEHEILIALNGLFPETIASIRAVFNDILPQENIRVWDAVGPVSDLDKSNDWRRQSSELLREAFLAALKPDIVHVMSVFEGFVDDAVTSIGTFCNLPTAVTLYDLIPFIHRHPYLDNPTVEAWYLKKLDHFRRADLWLAISESSRLEGLEYLSLPDAMVVNVSTAADHHFQKFELSEDAEHGIRKKYGLQHPFVMYTGGIDHRKNIDGLIRAFALLPLQIRCKHQLAIVCSARPEDKHELLCLAEKLGLSAEDVILTGFVPEEDLVALYNLCKLFVFPSWHEGFGLPALEAMHCGAPVIGANTSSLPEVIGWDDALFDPRSDVAIATAMERALGDELFRAELIRHGNSQAKRFSWDETARRAIVAFERFHAEGEVLRDAMPPLVRRPKLAYVSPLPPTRSGIADYSAELLPELDRLYEVELILDQAEVSDAFAEASWPVRTVEWFLKHADRYERVLYHFGNSDFHKHMFDLLPVVPGVVVLHDFFLSGIVAHMEVNGFKPDAWVNELYHSHGYLAVQERFHTKDTADVIWKFPCNLSVLQNSLGIIVHSENSLMLAQQWYGAIDHTEWPVIPLMRQAIADLERSKVRAQLGFKNDDFVVCSFGIMGPTKLNHRLLNAWFSTKLHTDAKCHLIFVGENHPADYGQQMTTQICNGNENPRIRITGWVDMEEFRKYLTAADIGVQLRTLSRGEASAAVLDCMNYGLATIVNANGSMANLAEESVWMLPDEFSDEQLMEALETLWKDHARRLKLGSVAREIIREVHSPRRCADLYGSAIEHHYRAAETGIHALSSAIADISPVAAKPDLRRLAEAVAFSMPPRLAPRQLLVDISKLVNHAPQVDTGQKIRDHLQELLAYPPEGFRVEPVYATYGNVYRYARCFTLRLLNCPEFALTDEVVEFRAGDQFLVLVQQQAKNDNTRDIFFEQLRNYGVEIQLDGPVAVK